MDEFIKAMEGFIKASGETYNNWPGKKKVSTNWVECYNLHKAKWKVEDYLEIEDSDDIMVRWANGENKKDVRLSFSDQLIWLEFLEKTGDKK